MLTNSTKAPNWLWAAKSNMIIICRIYRCNNIWTIAPIMPTSSTCSKSTDLGQEHHRATPVQGWRHWIISMRRRWMSPDQRWIAQWWSSSTLQRIRTSTSEETLIRAHCFQTISHIKGHIWALWQTVETLKSKWTSTSAVTLEVTKTCTITALSTWINLWICSSSQPLATTRATSSLLLTFEQKVLRYIMAQMDRIPRQTR